MAQNGLYATDFKEQRYGVSNLACKVGHYKSGWNGWPFQLAELKIIEESRFQPIHKKGAAKKLSRVVEKLDRIAYTLFASLLAAKLFVSRKIGLQIEFSPWRFDAAQSP